MNTKNTKHPAALLVLLLTEVWERFGFYVVQGLLILYLTRVLNFSDDQGYEVLGAFTALAYIMPVFGGYIADKVLGFQKTIILGNILLGLGYALLAMPQQSFLYPALAIIVTGTGFFKPNISSLLGTFYKENDPRREAGFTLFYVGIYLGILLATSTSGFVQRFLGWHVSFAVAAAGMLVGLTTFISGMKILKITLTSAVEKTTENHISRTTAVFKNKFVLMLSVFGMIVLSDFLMRDYQVAEILIFGGSTLLLMKLFFDTFSMTTQQANKMLALIFLIVASIIFWELYFQMYLAFNLFVQRCVQRHVFGRQIPTVMFIGIEAVFLILLGGVFAKLWQKLSERNRNPSIGFKFALATLIMGLCFVFLLFGIYFSDSSGLVNPLWIVGAYFFVAIAELLLSPIGLSMVTTLAPKEKIGTMMGMWLLALGIGAELAGIIARQASVPKGITDPIIISQFYEHAFTKYAVYALLAGIIILMLTPILRRMSRGEDWRRTNTIKHTPYR